MSSQYPYLPPSGVSAQQLQEQQQLQLYQLQLLRQQQQLLLQLSRTVPAPQAPDADEVVVLPPSLLSTSGDGGDHQGSVQQQEGGEEEKQSFSARFFLCTVCQVSASNVLYQPCGCVKLCEASPRPANSRK